MPINTEYLSEDFIAYFENYFTPETWQEEIVSASGIGEMYIDLAFMAEGLSKSLTIPDTIVLASGVSINDIDITFDETNTGALYDLLYNWKVDQNTLYSEYLFNKILGVMIQFEPTIRLQRWFGISDENADILWNLLTQYRNKDNNLESAYTQAVFDYQNGVVTTKDGVIDIRDYSILGGV